MLCAMLIRLASLIAAALLPAAIAQDTGSIEGRVTNSTDHTGIAGAAVTIASQRATTDPSGAFRFTGLTLGSHTLSFAATGFFESEAKVRLDSGVTTAHVEIELVPHSSISGRVLDDEGQPVAGVRVEITQAVRGTGTKWSTRGWTVWATATDSDGHYSMDVMPPGTYLAMAQPNPRVLVGAPGQPARGFPLPPKAHDGEHRAWVRTYYPAVSNRGQAARLVLRGGTHLAADIRLLAVPVYAIRGMVLDDGGKPANATVSVIASEALDMPERQVQAHEGAFELSDVPYGDWRVIAEADRSGIKLRGTAPAPLSRLDLDDVTVRLAAPFALQAFVEPRGLGESPAIELYPTDAPRTEAAFSRADSGGRVQFPTVYPGRYTINVDATIPDHYLDSVLVGEQDVLGKEVTLAEGGPPIHIVFKPNPAGLRGTVENCGSTSILLLPQDEGLWIPAASRTLN